MISPAIPIFVALLAQAPARAPAAPTDKARAQALLNEGAELYDRGDLAEALGRFQSAYAAYPSPRLWFNIGQAQRDLGRQVEAMEAFEHFLAEAKDAPAGTLGEAHRSMKELRTKLGHVTISCATRGALVSVDGRRVGVTPLPAPLWLTPGIHQIGLGRYDLAPSVQRVDVAAGKDTTVTFQLRVTETKPPVATPAPEPAPPSAPTPRAAPEPMPPPPPPAAPPPAPVLVTSVKSPESQAPPSSADDAPWPALAHNWRFWTAVGGGVVLTAIIFAVASSGGDSGAPTTTLGSQRAFQ